MKEIATCAICNKKWLDFPFYNKRVKNRYCSKKCFVKRKVVPWNIGKKGLQVMSIETRKKMSESQKGNKSTFWKGGITPINKIIRSSIEYKLWREAVFKRDNYTCIWCNERGGELQADHIKPFSLYPELRFAIDNGRTLCRKCHQKTDTWGYKSVWSCKCWSAH